MLLVKKASPLVNDAFLVAFTDRVGEKERNSTNINQLNLQGLFYLLARRFYILPDVLLFLYLSS